MNCTHSIDFSRSDHGSGTDYNVVVRGGPKDTFSFSGCSAALTEGQACVSQYGITAGARLLVNRRGEVVAEGNCCNGVTNTVVSSTPSCSTALAERTTR